jgi:putative hemolysin
VKRLKSHRAAASQRRESAQLVEKVERNLVLGLISGLVLLALAITSASNAGQTLASAETITPGSPIPTEIGLIALLLLLNSIFVASETAIDLLRQVHVKHLKEGSSRQSERLQTVIEDKARYVATCEMASQLTRLFTIYVAFLLTMGLNRYLVSLGRPRDDETVFISVVCVATPILFLNLFIGDLIPRSYAALHPHRVSLVFFRLIHTLWFALWLPVSVMLQITEFMKIKFGSTPSFNMPNQAEEEIKTLVESAQETGEIEVDEKELLHSVFEFTDTVAREVMTPRVDMDAMPLRSEPNDVIRMMQETGHSRIPLYEETDDQIVGVIHAKDLLMEVLSSKDSKASLRKLMRPALFVPENKNLHELLREMQTNRNHLVIVQDEFGGTAGIVTIEDIVEELVGDIVDEYDVEGPEVVSTASGFVVEGKTHLDDVNEEIGSHLESEDFDTIAGYVFGLFGRQPDAGESIRAEGLKFTVADTDGRRIIKLNIEPEPQGAGQAVEA